MAKVDALTISFAQDKLRVLNQKEDLSRKGSVDQPIVELVDYINSLDNYYTTSSCSGRILLFSEVSMLSSLPDVFTLSTIPLEYYT